LNTEGNNGLIQQRFDNGELSMRLIHFTNFIFSKVSVPVRFRGNFACFDANRFFSKKENRTVMMSPRQRGKQAFSLVEVTLALGIFVFAGVALMGLLGFVTQGAHDSKEQMQAATIMESICATRRASPTANLTARSFPLPVLSTSASTLSAPIGLTWDGTQTAGGVTDPNARFGMIYNIVAPANYTAMISPGQAIVYICIYWPAGANPTGGSAGRLELSTSFLVP
jgi:type II secretory pathway pseudopilin PulG